MSTETVNLLVESLSPTELKDVVRQLIELLHLEVVRVDNYEYTGLLVIEKRVE